jgi:phenylacetate-CoA ligase
MCKYSLKARRVLNAAWPFGQRLLVLSEQSDNTNQTLESASWGGRLFAILNLCIEQPVPAIVDDFVRFQPSMIYGTPSYLEYLAELTSDKGHTMPEVPVVFSSGEIVTEHIRRRLEEAYSGRLFDVYGSTEFKEIAVQCEYGQYHVNFESVYVESHPGTDSSHPRLLLTSLVNKAMPLIRYDIGDHGFLQDRACACGRHGPCIVAPQGRKSEMLRFPDGFRVSSYTLTTIVGAYPTIKNYTIVHRSPLEISLRVYAEPPLDHDTRSAVLADLADKLPADVRISIESLSERLPVTKRVAVRRDF